MNSKSSAQPLGYAAALIPYGKSGFIQSPEFLKRFFKFAQQSSRPGKSLEK